MRVDGPRVCDLDLIKIKNQKHAAAIAHAVIPHDDKEHMISLLLTPKGRVIGWNHIAMGSMLKVYAQPREIFLPALTTPGCSAVILVHNHPSGDATPSAEDLENTADMMKAANLLGIYFADHIVLGDDRTWTSIRSLAMAHETKKNYRAAARVKRRGRPTRGTRRRVQFK